MLNKKQNEVVVHNSGPLVNIAGPGSGKTHTLIEKIKHLININDITILDKILVLTFTNNASLEIKNRALKNFTYTNPHSLYFGTYHSIFKTILRQEKVFYDFGLGVSPSISMPSENKRSLVNQFKKSFQSKYLNMADAAVYDEEGDILTNTIFKKKIIDVDNLLKLIDNVINNTKATDLQGLKNIEELYSYIFDTTIDKVLNQLDIEISNPLMNDDRSIFGRFMIDKLQDAFSYKSMKIFFKKELEKHFYEKIEQKIVTFNDIILLTLFSLTHNNDLKNTLHSKFEHIFIDEFQDTNIIQGEILKIINNNNICVIGDPYQSIYGFLGGTVDNILNAAKDYNANIIQLDENYRSSQNIVDFTNQLVNTMDEQIEQWKPNKASSNLPNSKIKLLPHTSKDDQRQYIIQEIKNSDKDKKICIINRSGFDFLTEKYLAENKLKFKKLGGLSLKESIEVQSFTMLFTYILDNKKTNALSYFLSKVEGIGDKSVENFIDSLKSKSPKKTPKKIQAFFDELTKLQLNEILPGSVSTNNEVIALTSRVRDIYDRFIFPKISKSWKEDKTKLGKQKVNVIIDDIMEKTNYIEILTTLDNYYLDKNDKKNEEESNLTFSTIHSAKGLEWDTVFLIEWGDYNFQKDKPAEAQRLNYVAVSRAKTELHILSAEQIFCLDRNFVNDHDEIFESSSFTPKRIPKPIGILNFGKHKGKLFEDVPRSYLYWLYDNSSDFYSRNLLAKEDIDILQKILFSH